MQSCHPWTPGLSAASIEAGRRAQAEQMEVLVGPSLVPHGYLGFGPVSPEAGAYYVREFAGVAASISEEGYLAELGYPVMELLRDGAAWAGRILDGNHRCAVVAALGRPTITVQVAPRPVRRRDATRWPGVRTGAYSEADAVAVFDRFLHAEPPPGFPSREP